MYSHKYKRNNDAIIRYTVLCKYKHLNSISKVSISKTIVYLVIRRYNIYSSVLIDYFVLKYDTNSYRPVIYIDNDDVHLCTTSHKYSGYDG